MSAELRTFELRQDAVDPSFDPFVPADDEGWLFGSDKSAWMFLGKDKSIFGKIMHNKLSG